MSGGTTEVFWTSDLHFFHKKIGLFCQETRQGDTVEEMNELIIEKWNKKVRRGDLVRHLGDFSFGTIEETIQVLKRLNGSKHFIRGNHDRILDTIVKTHPNLMQTYKEYDTVKVGNDRFVLFHFPISSWDRAHYGSIHVHGHLHGGKSNGESGIMKNRVDCGIDNHPNKDMSVFSHEELIQLIKVQNKSLLTNG